MTDLLVSLQAVTIRYPDGTLFPDTSFEVRRGEHWALVGAHDALKTALLEAMAGRAGVIHGHATYPFFDKWHQQHPDEGFVSPQRFIQLVSLRHPFRNLSNTTEFYYQQRFNSSDSENAQTVQDYLSTITAHTPQAVWTFEKVVTDLALQPLLDETLIKLSNGETKRVLIAAALLRNPVLLLLHNPLAGLDVTTRQHLLQLVNDIADSGTTIVMSTSPHEVPDAITHVAVFNQEAALVSFLKKDFDPHTVTPASVPPIDVAEVKALLALNPVTRFDTIIGMKGVTIRYDNHTILDNINWTVRQGEHWALTGHNGSGKSTLLSLVNGDNPQAFANDIVLFDRQKGSGESIWDIKKKIGFFSPELYQYFPGETSCLQAVESGFYDTIGLFRPSHAYTSGIALRWMQLLDVAPVAHKLLKNVSPMQQRLCLLARALVKTPVLLLLDEPCQGFDETEQARFRQLIDAVCANNEVTLVYVSHYEAEMPACITKRLRLQAGRQV